MAIEIPPETRTFVDVLFAPLNVVSAAHSFPHLGHLAANLLSAFPNRDELQVTIDRQKSKYFATASVEAWHRAIHSFLISCSLTSASPLWSSVSGYYASHYAMRALAHLLGYFLLYDRKLVIRMTLDHGGHHCSAIKKDAGSGEHKFYWKIVKKSPCFSADPLFTLNPEKADISDSGHRNRANYADHVSGFPQFAPLEKVSLTSRVEKISSIEMQVPPIPNRRSYPDLESVQIVAYHRIVRYRRIVDEILGGKNRFWTVQRSPAFANEYCDYQITESGNLSIYRKTL
ncbi:MAG TPA: hypothetical protein VGY55_02105 [Pirellulales bacterium]|jgi:hypothetical protein|nr:hypothetical protein [Pirellulales bacterium]